MEKNKINGFVIIPLHIWENQHLSAIEKLFWTAINKWSTSKGCSKTNKEFATFFDLSVARVSTIINSLIKKDVVESFIDIENGSMRTLFTK